MHKRKMMDQWMNLLSGAMNTQAQRSFQVGLFEQIADTALTEGGPKVIKALNNLLNCANLLLNHARENMAMINRINHSGMWSMYFGEGLQISRVMYSDEFREIVGYMDRNKLEDTFESWSSKIYASDRDRVLKEFQDTVKDTSEKKCLMWNTAFRPARAEYVGCAWPERSCEGEESPLNS